MGIKERISKIGTYFKEMQIVTIDGKQVIYVIVSFPHGWVIDDEIEEKFDVTVSSGDILGEYYFCVEMEVGEEKVFDAIEYNIEKMKEAIERAQLLSEKTKELRLMFEDESITLTQLRNLKIVLDSQPEVISFSKKKDKDKNNSESKRGNDE
jgi:hypothetical protein